MSRSLPSATLLRSLRPSLQDNGLILRRPFPIRPLSSKASQLRTVPHARIFALAAAGSLAFVLYSSGSSLYLDAPPTATEGSSIVEPATQIKFPSTIQPISSGPSLTLVGLGVRTVSFLRVKVYAIAFYADLSNIKLPLEAAFEENINRLIDEKTVAVQIVPARNTSYSHLRDAFLRSLRGRIQAARKDGNLAPAEEDALEEPLLKLREVFPNTQLDKGVPLVVYSAPAAAGSRSLVLQGLGTVADSWIAKHFFAAYFVGEGNSPALLKSVQEGLAKLPPN